MTERWMLDTNICSYAVRGRHPTLTRYMEKMDRSAVFISVITEAELIYGLERSSSAELHSLVRAFLLRVDVLSWDSRAAHCYVQKRVQLESAGTPISTLDLMIASHALASDSVLVTNDRAFRHVKDLRLEDWTRA